jgi:hypothetical protein
VNDLEPGWRPGDEILVDLPDGQRVRCRIINVAEDGTMQVVPSTRPSSAEPVSQGRLTAGRLRTDGPLTGHSPGYTAVNDGTPRQAA